MTVRRVIWLWQVLEASVLAMVLSIYVGFIPAVFWLFPIMLSVRAGCIGMVCLFVAWMNPRHRLTGRQFLHYWFQELLAFCRLYFYEQAKSRPALSTVTLLKQNHLIFAHGFMCNDGFWPPFASAALKEDYSVSGVEMATAFGDIGTYAQSLKREIDRVIAINPQVNITLIGFSMGGLACRALPADTQKQVNLITIYTPHNGTRLAGLTAPVKAINGQQMRMKGSWLMRLNQTESSFKRAAGVWTLHDTVVIPSENGRPDFPSLMLKGRGHLSAAFDQRLHRHILRLLRFMSRSASSSSLMSQAEGIQIPD